MVFSTYEKQWILFFHMTGLTPSQILSALMAENIVTTRQTIARFINTAMQGRPSKITNWVLQLVEQSVREDDGTTAVQLHTLLTACGISISL